MENKEYIESLIYRTTEYPDGNSDEGIKNYIKKFKQYLKAINIVKKKKNYYIRTLI